MFPGNALPESTYTCKCDYVDSSMACNVSLCKIANDTLYGRGFTVAQRDNPMRRTATYGHAIELVNIVDNVEISLGAYTIIIDRYAEKSMGYDKKEYPNILILEGESNSDTGASSLHAYTNPESSGSQFANETEYINEGFKVVYPPTNEAAYDFADAKALVNFVDLASEDDFKDTFESYFNKESVLKYYLFCLCFASVDTLAKNLHFARYTDVWYILPYDLDSVLGGSNVGFLNISSSCEVGNVYDEKDPTLIVEPNQFNSWNGRLWARIRNIFAADLTAMWTTLRSNGTFNYDNFIKYFDEIWDAIPPTMYNSSQQIKYIDYGVTGQVALHGNRKHQIKKFLRERIAYLDSKFGFYSEGGTENYANIRMNVLGDVSLTIETYYPVYYTIKWATNNIETHRIAKNTKYTFSYFSDVSTDREVLLYLPHTLKSIENLDSLKPASIDVSKATKLTKLEVHSEKLYSVNVTNNKYLRTIDFNGCKLLGTDTISTLSILYAKYLKYLDVRGTQLTAVNFSPQGGSIVDCYLPKTITSLSVKNQPLLRNLILQDNSVDLATVEISNCPLIEHLSEVPTSSQFGIFKYCRSLLINNSFASTKEILLNGFTRLQNITLSNIEALENLGLNDLCEAGQVSGLRYVGVSNCKNLATLTMNCSSNDYEISFAKKGLLDLSTSNITEIRSNCVIKGLDTIVIPRTTQNMFFTSEYGSGYSEIFNIWSAIVTSIDSSGVFPKARHLDADTGQVDDYIGIDFLGLRLGNIDLSGLVNVTEAKNFYLSPTSVNPNFNKNRDGVEYPYLQPSGTLDLSNYTESLAKFFDGVDLDKLKIVCTKKLPQTDLSYCFYNSTFSNDTAINTLLSNVSSITNLDYCFYRTTVSDTSILSKINMGASSTMNYTFAECPYITILKNVTIPSSVIEVEGMFYKCPLTSITNMTVNVRGSISGLFKGCSELTTITTLRIPNITDASSTFEGCTSLTNLIGFELPTTCTNVSNLFNGCYGLTTISMNFSSNITAGENWYPPNLETLNDTTISNDYVKLTNCTTLKTLNNVNINGGDLSDLFNGCTNLVNINNCTFNATTSLARAFKGCSKITINPMTTIVDTVTDISEMYSGCVGITDISGMTFGSGITSATDWIKDCPITTANNVTIKNDIVKFNNCNTLREVQNLTITNTVTNLEAFLENCTSLTKFSFNKDSDLSKVTTIKRFLVGNKIISTLDFSGFNLTSLAIMCTDRWVGENLGFIANTNVSYVDFSNCEFGNKTILWIWITNNCNTQESITFDFTNAIMPVINFERFGWGSNAKTYFKFNGADFKYWTTFARMFATDATHINGVDFTDAKFSHITDFSDMFNGTGKPQENYIHITEDIVFPSTATNVERAFKGCTKLTHIHSNWNNTYDNDITSTDCYAGCNAIAHCDDIDLGINEYVNGLDEIPIAWGGYGFTSDLTGIYVFEIPSDNYTLTLETKWGVNGLIGDKVVTWGDNTSTTGVTSHTYTTSGRYAVKMHGYTSGNDYCHDSISECLVEVVKMPYRDHNLSILFNNCSKLRKVNMSNITGEIGYWLVNCNSLTEIIAYNVTLKGASSPLHSCYYLERIEGLNTWDTSQVTSMKDFFNGCSSLTEIDVSSFNTSNVNTMESMFKNYGLNVPTSKLKRIKGIENFDTSKVTNMRYMFQGHGLLESLDLGTWSTDKITDMEATFADCGELEFINISNINFNNVTDATGCFSNCFKLATIEGVENLITSKQTWIASIFKNCYKLKFNFPDGKPNWNFAKNMASMIGFMDGCGRDVVLQDGEEYILDLSDCGLVSNNNLVSVFANTGFTKIYLNPFICSNVNSDNRSFVGFNNNLKEFKLGVGSSFAGDVGGMCNGCPNLLKADFIGVDFTKATNRNGGFTWAFAESTKLTDIIFEPLQFIECSPKFGNSPSLTIESLVNILNSLGDLTGKASNTCTLGSTNLAKLNDEQIAIATNKNWSLA